MAVVNSTEQGFESCDAYSIVVLSDDCELPMALSTPSAAEVCNPLKSQLSLDARLSNQSYIDMIVENAVAYSTCTRDDDVEEGAVSETQRNEQVLTKSLQKQMSFDKVLVKQIKLQLRKFLMLPNRGSISALLLLVQEKLFSCSQSCRRVWEQ